MLICTSFALPLLTKLGSVEWPLEGGGKTACLPLVSTLSGAGATASMGGSIELGAERLALDDSSLWEGCLVTGSKDLGAVSLYNTSTSVWVSR